MSTSSSSRSSSSKSQHHHHHAAGQSPTISVDEYLSRCFQAIDDLADNPYLNGTLRSPDDDGPVHMGRSGASSSSPSKRSQALRSHTTVPILKSVRTPQAAVHQPVDVQERLPIAGGNSSSPSSKGESSGAKGLKRAFKRPSLFK